MHSTFNFFDLSPAGTSSGEAFDDLLAVPGLRVERIVSRGQVSPPGFWYEQGWDEWVLVVDGEARLEIEGQSEPLCLAAGDHAWLPAGCRHRVTYTRAEPPTVWLAVHRHISGGLPA
ncbi:MAG: cupin domain-containing protein [Pusillimonas sp.]